MSILKYTRDHINSLLSLISKLKQSEFPYYSSFSALEKIEERFNKHLSDVEGLDTVNEATLNLCRHIMVDIYNALPILGFILRSTNVRNAFEMYPPLYRLVQAVLGENKKIILSSEWEYSPYTYGLIPFRELSEYILIGFPSSESDNPLLLPLAGHEIGHHVWKSLEYDKTLRSKIIDEIINIVSSKQNSITSLFPNIDLSIFNKKKTDISKNKIQQDIFLSAILGEISLIVLKQLEEIFCDFVGLFLFKEAFVYAFIYSFSPGIIIERNICYPDIYDRINYIVFAAQKMDILLEEDFESYFEKQKVPSDRYDRFYLEVADNAAKRFIPDLIASTIDYMKNKEIPEYNTENVKSIVNLFMDKVSPITQPYSLTEIINAGWSCYKKIGLWNNGRMINCNSQRKQQVLKDLLLKSMEILEIYNRLENSDTQDR